MHAESAWLMGRVQGGGASSLMGMLSHPGKAASGPAFGEMMARAASSTRLAASPKIIAAPVVPEPNAIRCEAADEAAAADRTVASGEETDPSSAASAIQPRQVKEEPKAQAAAPSRKLLSPVNARPAAGSAPATVGSKKESPHPAKAAQGEPKAAEKGGATAERVASRTHPLAEANPKAATGPIALAEPVRAQNPATEDPPNRTGDVPAVRITAPAAESSPAEPGARVVTEKIPAARPISVSAPVAQSAPAASTTESRSESSAGAQHVSAENHHLDAAAATPATILAVPAAKAAQHLAADGIRATVAAAFPSANASGPSAVPNGSPVPVESTGGGGLSGSLVHALHASAPAAAASSAGSAPPAVSIAFTRMDSAPPPRVIETAPQRLSVGVRDSGLGWVEIRTHATAGQVSAVLATGSSEAHAALQAHLPELREYLAGQQVQIDQLASERFSTSGGSRESAQQQSRNGAAGDAAKQGDSSPAAAGFNEGTEESLTYINVRV